jgi:hypothetical protein
MNSGLFILTSFFILMSLVISLYKFLLSKKVSYFIINSIILILCVIVLYKYFYIAEIPIPKGSQDTTSFTTWLTIGLCFIAMIIGMLCQFLYLYYTLPKKDRDKLKKDWGGFIAPICVSPIVFIPLATLLQNVRIDFTNPSITSIMSLFIAFQNGFFWKEIFDHHRKKK